MFYQHSVSCHGCGFQGQIKSLKSLYFSCPKCFVLYKLDGYGILKIKSFDPCPEDMTPLRIGTLGVEEGKKFQIIGRTRYMYDSGYMNEWNILFEDNSVAFLGEGYGFYSIYRKEGVVFTKNQLLKLSAGKKLTGQDKRIFYVTNIHKNKAVTFEGELLKKADTDTGFVSLELLKDKSDAGYIFIYSKEEYDFYAGKFYDFEELSFTNIRDLHEWK